MVVKRIGWLRALGQRLNTALETPVFLLAATTTTVMCFTRDKPQYTEQNSHESGASVQLENIPL